MKQDGPLRNLCSVIAHVAAPEAVSFSLDLREHICRTIQTTGTGPSG
jgi:hypothetical protein